MPYNRVEKGRGQGLPGNADFRVQDLQDGDTIQWDASINRWVLSRLSDTGTGTVVVTTLNDLTDLDIAGATTGSLLYFNGTSWVDLGVGAEGQVLTASSGMPAWATPEAGGSAITLAKTVDTLNPTPVDAQLSGTIVEQGGFYRFTAHFEYAQGTTNGIVRPRIAGRRIGTTNTTSSFQTGNMGIHIIHGNNSATQDNVTLSAGILTGAITGLGFQESSIMLSGHFQVNAMEDAELDIGLSSTDTTTFRAGSWITLERTD